MKGRGKMDNILQQVYQPFQWLVGHPLVLGWLLLFLIAATYTDLKSLKIPNKLNAVLAMGNVLIFVVYPLIAKDLTSSLNAIGASATGFIALLIPAVVTGFKMAGDIKFIGALGFALTPISMVAFLAVSVVLNAVTNGLLIVTKRKTFEAVIPFAPFFASSFILLLLLA